MLDPVREFRQKRGMKQLIRLTILFCACAALALTVVAGPEPLPSGKEMKEVAPAPLPECNWSGFYIGLNVGGNWGHAENTDVDDYNFFDKPWGYSDSGVVAGGQIGYNYQLGPVVFGIEADVSRAVSEVQFMMVVRSMVLMPRKTRTSSKA